MTTTGARVRLREASFAILAAIALVAESHGQTYDPSLQYTRRGRHYEGLRTIPIAGGVQLLSARVVGDRLARLPTWQDLARIRFYLPREDSVTLTVRQLRSGSTYYMLDRVDGTWKVGAINEYAWPTAPVLRKLTNVQPDDLGAVVNLGSGKDTTRETVLPAVFFGDVALAGALKTYRFSLKTDGRARVDVAIFSGARRVFQRPTNWEEPGSPFTIMWPAEGSAEGWYRLVLGGQFDDGTRLDKEVAFYHRPPFDGGPPR